MSRRMLDTMTIGAALGCGLIAGVFFAFSTFVMPALANLPAPHGIAAMQSINVSAINRWLMSALFGTGAVGLGLLVVSVSKWSEPGMPARVIAGAVYMFGVIGVTAACNVPRNDALAALAAEGADAAVYWPRYVSEWVAWNTVRMMAGLVSSVLFMIALMGSRAWSGAAPRFSAVLAACLLGGCDVDRARPIAAPGSDVPRERISELGIFGSQPQKQITRADFVAYDVNVSAFADGAEKKRFVHVPSGSTIRLDDGRSDIPVGAYFVKSFAFPVDARHPSLGERLVETRFLVKTASGLVASTYLWNAAQTDAIASAGNVDVPITWIDASGTEHHQRYHVPGTSECESCHEGRVLGFRSRQLAGVVLADGADQVTSLVAAAVVVEPTLPHVVLASPKRSASLDARARSYLDANCAHCHGDGGSAEHTDVWWDLEHTSAGDLPTCTSTRSVARSDFILVPGHPERSAFLARMKATDPDLHMPRGPTRVVDAEGVDLLTKWVAAMPSRPCE